MTIKGIKLIYHCLKFIIVVALGYFVYKYLLMHILTRSIHVFLYITLWAITSYFILPQLTKRLTTLYVPNYFIGRTRTSLGILGDPINMAFNGELLDIIAIFESSGWSVADNLTFLSGLKIVISVLCSKAYKSAPVSPLYLFESKQTIAFELEIGKNPRKRHHVRLWQVPETFYLPGGKQVQWFAAATKDNNVGLSLFTGQVTHKIDSDVDLERDTIVKILMHKNGNIAKEEYKYFTSSYHGRNGGGDAFYTDGSLIILDVIK